MTTLNDRLAEVHNKLGFPTFDEVYDKLLQDKKDSHLTEEIVQMWEEWLNNNGRVWAHARKGRKNEW